MTKITTDIKDCINALEMEQVVIYPAEAVYGIGCVITSKNSIARIKQIKERSDNQGLIIIAGSWQSVAHLVEEQEGLQNDPFIASWSDNTTFVFNAAKNAPNGLCVQGNDGARTLAIRISKKSIIQKICQKVGPIISTSANFRKMPAPNSFANIDTNLINKVDLVLKDDDFSHQKPSTIMNFYTKKILR